MKMSDCPKYETCAANLCPLDPAWRTRSHHRSDRMCLWVLESAKPTREKVFVGEQGAVLSAAADTLTTEVRAIVAESPMGAPRGLGEWLASLDAAKDSGSRILAGIEAGKRFSAQRDGLGAGQG